MMKNRELPDIDLLRQLLTLDATTGLLRWNARAPELFKTASVAASWNARCAGQPAFTAINTDGYRVGNIINRTFRAHVVVYALHTGAWPLGEIDHVNGNKEDNRPCNLLSVDHVGNMRNRTLAKNNTTGVCGVFQTKSGRWSAGIGDGGRFVHLGTFSTLQEAAAVRKARATELGYTARHGT